MVSGFHAGICLHQQQLRQLNISGLSQTPEVKPSPCGAAPAWECLSKTSKTTLKLPVCPNKPLTAPIHFKVTAFLTLTAPSHKAGKLVPGPLRAGQAEEAERRGMFVGERRKKSWSRVWCRKGCSSLPSPLTSLL